MIQPLRRLAAALTAALVAASLTAQEPAPTELTLEQCIARALQRNFSLEIGRYAPQIAADAIIAAKGGYEPQLSLTASRSGSETGPAGNTASGTDLRAGVTQRLYTGTTLSASSSLDRSSTNPALATNPAYDADLTLSVRQSLLQGAGLAINRAPIRRAEIGLVRANLEFKAQVLDVILDTENAYFALAFSREQLAVRRFSLALAERLFEEAKTRRDTGVATDLDVLQAEVGVANARRGVILAEQAVNDRQDALLALIGQFELDAPVGTVRFKETDGTLPVFASSFALAKSNQPDFISSQAAIEQFQIDLQLAKDAVKPDLSVGAALGLNGRNGSGGDAFSDALDPQSHAWQVDLALNYPWGRKADKARERQSLAALSREQTRLRLIEQTIEVQVRSAVRAVEANTESVKIAAQASGLSQKQYELEKEKFNAGLSTSRRVLEAQDDLETARVNELQARVTLHNAIAALHRLEGSSLQRYGVELP